MGKTLGRILKANNVKLEGQIHLGVDQAELSLPKEKITGLATPQVRIVEKHPEFAVIEITCSCGTRTYLKCEYAGAESSAKDSQTQNSAFGVANQVPDQAK